MKVSACAGGDGADGGTAADDAALDDGGVALALELQRRLQGVVAGDAAAGLADAGFANAQRAPRAAREGAQDQASRALFARLESPSRCP